MSIFRGRRRLYGKRMRGPQKDTGAEDIRLPIRRCAGLGEPTRSSDKRAVKGYPMLPRLMAELRCGKTFPAGLAPVPVDAAYGAAIPWSGSPHRYGRVYGTDAFSGARYRLAGATSGLGLQWTPPPSSGEDPNAPREMVPTGPRIGIIILSKFRTQGKEPQGGGPFPAGVA